MVKLDLKDRKILHQLDVNSRQSFAQIGKRVGLSKNSVKLRVDRLIEADVIKNFYTLIDPLKLGYTSIWFHITYQYTTPETEQQIRDFFVRNEDVGFVAPTVGKYDLRVNVWVKKMDDLYFLWNQTIEKFGEYLQDKLFQIPFEVINYNHSYLLLSAGNEATRPKPHIIKVGKTVDIDELDIAILKIIATHGRMPLSKIGDRLSISPTTANKRIRKLTKLGVIRGFRVNYDFSQLNYKCFKAWINLREPKQVSNVIDCIGLNPHLICIRKLIGKWDMEFVIRVESIDKFYGIMNELKGTFPHIIKDYSYIYNPNAYKIAYTITR